MTIEERLDDLVAVLRRIADALEQLLQRLDSERKCSW